MRRELTDLYSEDKLYSEGYSVRTTLDPSLQLAARVALAAGLQKFDRSLGFRGPVSRIDPQGDWAQSLGAMQVPSDVNPWRLAMVLEVSASEAAIGFPKGEKGTIPLKLLKWARKAGGEIGKLGPEVKKATDVLAPGDVVYVAPATEGNGNFHLVQMPEVDGAIVAMDPHSGRVLALVGGFSYAQSQFNRAVQALRQPGSAFKPFVYAAALDNGYTPSSVVMDAPIEIRLENGEIWKPENYTKKFYGPSTLRLGIEKSRNAMTVRLAHDLGIEKFCDLVERLGIYDHLQADAGHVARRRRHHAPQDHHRLFDAGQWRQEDRADADRPRAGPLWPHHLPPRQARMHRLQRAVLDRPAGAGIHGPARGRHQSLHRLSDHLDAGGSGPARHRPGPQGGRQAGGRQDRHHQ